MKLKEKRAIITGGSSGIGRDIAGEFLKEGAHVFIVARDKKQLNQTVKELKNLRSSRISGISADISSELQVKKLISGIREVSGQIDILVNAAGIQAPIGEFCDTKTKEWVNNININLIGTMLCCKHVIPYLLRRKTGRIINFSGGGAVSPRPNFSAYAVSKAAVVRFTETLAEELRDTGIYVNAISPGAVNTRMLDEIISSGKKAGGKEFRDALIRKASPGFSSDLAVKLAVFLASDDSLGVTGKLISAPWDPWQETSFQQLLRKDKDFATLRRIDNKIFFKKP
jgi:NAD(P)-dependent dehydrogenase (short-subunit alcohol dehydrogenase family)